MAGTLQIKHGAKMRVAYDAPVGQEPKFNMVCTFNKAIDESAFLVSVPLVGGKALIPEDTQKMLFQYGDGDDAQIIAGYVDDKVKEGIRQLIKRIDVRMKIELPVQFMQDTWALNSDGEIDKEQGQTMDISNNGLAVYMNHWFDVGESCIFTLPRIGTVSAGQKSHDVVGVVCWMRELQTLKSANRCRNMWLM